MTATNVFLQHERGNVAATVEPGCDGDGDPDGAQRGAGGQQAVLLLRAERGAGDEWAGGAATTGRASHGRGSADDGADGGGGESGGPVANVPVNANIRVQFSGPIDPLTVNGTTIQVTAAGRRCAGLDQFQQQQPDGADHAAESAAGLDGR